MGGFFYDESTRSKLIVLYFVNSLNIELTRGQIADFAVGNDLVGYFDLQQTVAELEEAGLLAAVPRPFGQVYLLSEEGKQTLDMFKERIPQSQRDDMDIFANRQRAELRRQTQLTSSIKQLWPEKEGYMVTLRAVEGSRVLVSIDIALPDGSSASRAVERWPSVATDIYPFLIDKLAK